MSSSFDPQAIRIDANLDHLDLAREFVAEIAKRVPMNSQQVYDLELAVDEALTNVIEHGLADKDEKQVELSVTHENDLFTIVISHGGRDFNPGEHADPVMKEYLAERRVGGLGLFLMKKLMDQVEYTTGADGSQQIKLVKRHPTRRLE